MRKPLRLNVLKVTFDNAHLLTEWFPKLALGDALVLLNRVTDKAEQDDFFDSVHIAARQLMFMDVIRKYDQRQVDSLVSRLHS